MIGDVGVFYQVLAANENLYSPRMVDIDTKDKQNKYRYI